MPVRRPRKHAVHLEVTAFINVIVVLVPFLLSTAVFSHLAVMELSLPAQNAPGVEQLKVNDLKLLRQTPYQFLMRRRLVNDRFEDAFRAPSKR